MQKIAQPFLRKLREEDIPQVVRIEKQAFALPWTAESFRSELKNNDFAHYLVVGDKREEEKVLAYGGFWLILDEAHITNIAVEEAYRGQKISLLLMEGLINDATLKGARLMTLEVRRSNLTAISLYEKLGFIPEGVRKYYYTDNNEDALIMWANLVQGGKVSGENSDFCDREQL
jgi:ribosomal-protein-alanine N-acetyltransferase